MSRPYSDSEMTDQGAWYIQQAKDALCEGQYIKAKNFALAAETELGDNHREVIQLNRTLSKIDKQAYLVEMDERCKRFEDHRPVKDMPKNPNIQKDK